MLSTILLLLFSFCTAPSYCDTMLCYSRNGIYGSAVCAFSFSDVDNAFDGEFLEKKADCANTWNRVEDAPEKPEVGLLCAMC